MPKKDGLGGRVPSSPEGQSADEVCLRPVRRPQTSESVRPPWWTIPPNPTLEDEALLRKKFGKHYARQGLCCLPAIYASKRPAVRFLEYESRLPTQSEISEWCHKIYNIMILTGKISRLTVLDFDNSNKYYEALGPSRREIEGKTLVVRTMRGFHLYLRTSELVSSMTYTDCFEVKGEGALVIAPPSRHPAGCLYRPVSRTLKIMECPHVERYIEELLHNLNYTGESQRPLAAQEGR